MKTTLLVSLLLSLAASAASVVSTAKLPPPAQSGQWVKIIRAKTGTLPLITVVDGWSTGNYRATAGIESEVIHTHFRNGILIVDEAKGWPAWQLKWVPSPGCYIRVTVCGQAKLSFTTIREAGYGEFLTDWFPNVVNGSTVITEENRSDIVVNLKGVTNGAVYVQQVSYLAP